MRQITKQKISQSLKRHHRMKRNKRRFDFLIIIIGFISWAGVVGHVTQAQTSTITYTAPEVEPVDLKVIEVPAGASIELIQFLEKQDQTIHPLAFEIDQAIVRLETNGYENCHTLAHPSGEIGCRGYLPSTFELYSKIATGEVLERTERNEQYVTLIMITNWLEKGYTPYQIALRWNQGHAGKCRSGVNQHGVKYNSCAYANRLVALVD